MRIWVSRLAEKFFNCLVASRVILRKSRLEHGEVESPRSRERGPVEAEKYARAAWAATAQKSTLVRVSAPLRAPIIAVVTDLQQRVDQLAIELILSHVNHFAEVRWPRSGEA